MLLLQSRIGRSVASRGAPLMVERGSARPATWNPAGVPLPSSLGDVLTVGEYTTIAPPYLDGTMAGDVGFDPMCLVALASPSVEKLRHRATASQRKEALLAMSPADQRSALEWMRTSELKHARLAMLCATGWPVAELVNGAFLQAAGTSGRAPSLLNGGLVDSPGGNFVLFVFGFAALVELSGAYYGVNGGDYEFDPLGIASGEGPLPQSVPNVGAPSALQPA